MLNQITWAGYCTALFILLFVYYLCILYCYFRHEVMLLLSGKLNLFKSDGISSSQLNSKVNTPNPLREHSAFHNSQKGNELIHNKTQQELSSLVHDLTHDLKLAIHKAGKQNFKKQELLFSLQMLLKDYEGLKETNFIEAINNLITNECQNSCSIPLSDEDIKMLWV